MRQRERGTERERKRIRERDRQGERDKATEGETDRETEGLEKTNLDRALAFATLNPSTKVLLSFPEIGRSLSSPASAGRTC